MYKLHKLPKEGFIITSDGEINLKDKYLYSDQTKINTRLRQNPNAEYPYPEYKKVIAQQDQIDFTFLSEEDQKKIGWFDVDKLISKDTQRLSYEGKSIAEINAYKNGGYNYFQKAVELLSDRVLTLEEGKKLMKLAWLEGCDNRLKISKCTREDWENSTINSLSQKSWDIEIEKVTFFSKLSSSIQPILTKGKIKLVKIT